MTKHTNGNLVLVGMALIMVLFFLSACNTVEGMGKDIERAGQTIQDTF